MADCYLGNLPPELIDGILEQFDSISALSHFIMTAGFIYQRFASRKRLIIRCVLQNELGPVLADARFLRVYPYIDPQYRPLYSDRRGGWLLDRRAQDLSISYFHYRDRQLNQLSPVYRDMLNTNGGDMSSIDMEELTQLCHMLHKINFLASAYFAAHQRTFGGDPLSRVERLRIVRSFYRRQILCNIWTPSLRQDPYWTNDDVRITGNTNTRSPLGHKGFFSAFEPWELQQIDHVDQFVRWQCKARCSRNGDQFGQMFSHVEYLVCSMREHPDTVDVMPHTAESISTLENSEVRSPPAYDTFIRQYALPYFGLEWQSYRRIYYPDPARDQPEQYQLDQRNLRIGEVIVTSIGDAVATIDFVRDDIDLPPFGWVDAIDGQYINWWGGALCRATLAVPVPDDPVKYFLLDRGPRLWRDTGFALWDQSRVEALKRKPGQLELFRRGWIFRMRQPVQSGNQDTYSVNPPTALPGYGGYLPYDYVIRML
ncbi:hypothetical protein F5Y10DRAFT_290476 [Nemania abortiva]|nr:hypothetical protein F5Y10DRAFT_290476 [Nemania abortiva]